MSIGTPLKRYAGGDAFDAIVIGSGMGGLTAARLLAQHGDQRVAVLERHYTAGGFTHSFHRTGFEWDVGLHYVGEVHRPDSQLRRIFDHVTEGALAWQPMAPVYDRLHLGGNTYDLTAGREAFRAMLQRAFPAERRGIDRYLDLVRRCNAAAMGYYVEKVLPAFLANLSGALLRAPFRRYSDRTTLETIRGVTRNPELIGVLTGQYLDYGPPPGQSSFAVHATIVQHYLDGAAYPIGGAGAIAAAIVPLVERSGGVVLVDAEVREIALDRGAAIGVHLQDGRTLRAPIVVSDAGLSTTVRRLLPRSAPGWSELDGILNRIEPSCSHVSLYLGLDRTACDLGLETTNLWIFPGPDHDANVARFTADPEAPFPTVYISFPSAKDPDFERRHPGHATIEAISMLPYERIAPWADSRWHHRGPEYEALKGRLADRLLEHVLNRVPAARGHVIHSELSTPLTTRHFANHEHGEIYGLQSTPARYRERGLRPRTPITGLFLTGSDVAGHGIAGAMMGGVLTASVVLKRNLIGAVSRPR